MTKRENSERGAIAIIVAAMLTTLSAFAALAIDAGFLYTKSRNIQAVADAAVTAGMPLMPNAATSQNAALAIIDANGTFTSRTATVGGLGGNELTVQITQVVPSFFGRMLAVGNKTLTGRAVGQLLASSAPALMALGDCASGWGLRFNGGEGMTINGNVQSMGILNYSTSPNTTTNGNAQGASCGIYPQINAHDTVTGSQGVGGPFTNPFSTVAFAGFPPCTVGDLATPMTWIDNMYWTGPVLDPGVYCSSTDLSVTSPDISQTIIALNVTFLAMGQITIGANNGGDFSPSPGSPFNINVYTTSNTLCSSGPPAINIGQNNLIYNASVYAPNGCINMGGGNNTFTGSLIAREVNISPQPGAMFGNTVFNAPGGGGGGGSWRMKN